jgi:HEAT repeat protein
MGRTMLAARALCLAALLLSPLASAFGAETAAPGTAPAPEATAVPESEKRRDTIRYGIESEILDLVKKLGDEKDGAYNDDLAALLKSTRSTKLRVAIFDLFATLEWKGVEPQAIKNVDERDRNDSGVVVAALNYLAAIKSKDALQFSAAIIKEDDKKLLPSLMRLMGRSGAVPEEELLLGWFESDSATEPLRQEAIKALGEIGSTKAAERLAALAKDPEKNKVTRMFACEALGKIKDTSSIPALVEASNGEDPNVRASAVEALAAFGTEASDAAIVEALRDSFVKSRIAACKAIATRQIASAEPFLRYKASNDPEKTVRTEALRSLAALGGNSFSFLRERMDDTKADVQTRALCFGLLARKDAAGSMATLAARLSAEAAEKERSLYTALVRELANAQDAADAGPLARILLADKDPLIRIGAIEWARKNKAADFKAELERLAKEDPSEMIRKRASEALATW